MVKIAALLTALSLAIQLLAADRVFKKPTDQEVRKLDVWSENNDHYAAVVSAVDFGAGASTRVTFSQLRLRDSQGKELPVERTLVWTWDQSRPVPVVKGMAVSVDVSKNGEIVEVSGDVQIVAYRKNGSGELEVIAKLGGAASGPPYLYLRPNWLNLAGAWAVESLCWSNKYGTMITAFAAGDSGSEVESSIRRAKGIPVANDPSFKFSVGRNGWRLLPNQPPKRLIPDAQKIWSAG